MRKGRSAASRKKAAAQLLKESPTFVVFKPHPKLGQDVIPEGITELQNLKDCRQEKVVL